MLSRVRNDCNNQNNYLFTDLVYLHSNNLNCLYSYAEQSVNKVATTICYHGWIETQ